MENTTPFDIAEARELYNIDRWGGGYFGINPNGHVCVFPKRNSETIDLMDVVARGTGPKAGVPACGAFPRSPARPCGDNQHGFRHGHLRGR
jgi:arginine decarboxylase